MRKTIEAFVVFAFLATTCFTSVAQAGTFTVRVDCHGNGGKPTWAPTNGQTRWEAMFSDGTIQKLEYWDMDANTCSKDASEDIVFQGSHSTSDVVGIRVTIFGPKSGDMFFLDKLQLWDGAFYNYLAAQWGVDDNIGYCFSTDSSDDGNSYCWNKNAYRVITFWR